MQRCCFLSDYYSVLGCNFPKSYFVLITGSKSEPMRVGSVGIVLVFMPCEFDSTITATPLSKCISPETERLNVILEYSRGKTEFINIFWRNTHITYYIYIYAFSRCFYPKRLTVHSGYTCFITMCVPWELNPQPFALLTQCSTTEPQDQHTDIYILQSSGYHLGFAFKWQHAILLYWKWLLMR